MSAKNKNSRAKVQKVSNQTTITTVIGQVHTGTGDILVNAPIIIPPEFIRIITKLRNEIEDLPEGTPKSIAQNAIQGIETEAQKGEDADESSIKKWLQFLAEVAPDAWEVAIDMLVNPIKGISTIFSKVAARAKAEREANH